MSNVINHEGKTTEAKKGTSVGRRNFLKGSAAAAVLASAPAMANIISEKKGFKHGGVYDYIVVGSGPGGGPLAANLAKAGYRVAVLEAGVDPLSEETEELDPSVKAVYETPGFFAAASEHPLLSWEIYVNHYSNRARQVKDFKYVKGKGVLYPRGSCVGGSASHNALIFCYPHDSDFDSIAKTTGDYSWSAEKMREYFIRIEDCQYCKPAATGHGYDGYIPTSMLEKSAYSIFPLINDITNANSEIPDTYYQGNITLDVNDPTVAKGGTGRYNTPMNTIGKKRVAIREHLIETQKEYPKNLDIFTNALVTRVITKNSYKKSVAIGVEYLENGGMSYKAHKLSKFASSGTKVKLFARREVILSGGAFNTPQLLKLSGIGPSEELLKHRIKLVKHLPGVGRNLQDRYEVPVIFNLNESNKLFERCMAFQANDPCLESYISGNWTDEQGVARKFSGPYAGNPVFATRIAKSSVAKGAPDLFLVGLPLAFKGYYPNYSYEPITASWTWLVLKAHTENTAGTVTLRSTDPTDTPIINFNYFEEGNADDSDLKAVVEGIRLIRKSVSDPEAQKHLNGEAIPGVEVDTQAELEQYVRNVAWGHHASCTAKIGSDSDPMAVLDSRFRVRGVKNLRVVDASAFPKTPGFFPTAGIIMISEKASDVILEDAKHQRVIELDILTESDFNS